MESLITIIILGIVITITIAVVLWIQSASLAQSRKIEILDLTQSYIEKMGDKVKIHVFIYNRGTTDSAIETILVNNRPVLQEQLPIIIASGERKEIVIETSYRPGVALRVDLISAKGNTYTIMLNPP